MEKKNYNKMFQSNKKVDEDVATPAELMEDKAPEEEPEKKKEVKPAKKKTKTGTVIGDLNLNVRVEPNGTVIGSLTPSTKVVIEEDLGDWYKISSPSSGYVMKKFIEA